MATVILQAAGTLIGSVFGPVGAAIGRAAGALAGYALDRSLLTSGQRVEGARLAGGRTVSADEGASIARVYGAARVSGTIIWATRFEEVASTSRRGGKGGGPKVTEYRYFGNAAIGLCEGPVACIRRIWADGRELDLDTIELRLHRGTEDQAPDPLIEAKQGTGNAPAYRGLAYVVFERLPLDPYGNRIPQIQVEVVRPVGRLEANMRAVCLIPGATEHGLAPAPLTASPREGETLALNRHVRHAASDFEASIDELVALCPELRRVALVIAWYGNDLRAGECTIRPGVTTRAAGGESQAWLVSGETRATAHLVSLSGGRSAYGGTPTDASVVAAIRALKDRGLEVTVYPFVLMDVPDANGLPDPNGSVEQPAHPWRGRITCHPAPGQAGTVDRTATAAVQVAAFLGAVSPASFTISGEVVNAAGADFGYRRFVLHCAHLCAVAGGVDAFLVGSELRGLTSIRGATGDYPFVDGLRALAADVRSVIGPATKLTYAADWSEYFGHHPQDASGDVFFNLDPLWADPNIDAVAIDNYMPLSDWRDGDALAGSPDGQAGANDRAAFRAAIAGGEGFDWYYASSAHRDARQRSPIVDGLAGRHWVYRYKDLVGWWSNAHRNRVGGVESPAPTAWTPESKPVWFTELGCPAVDKGANQPNVFPDPKSSENALPYHSAGARDDASQRAFLESHFEHWEEAGPHNPVSSLYGSPMVPGDRIFLWAWDTRPYPAFPLRGDIWGDGDNWQRGHWLNGRLGNAPVEATAKAILADHGITDVDVGAIDGTVQGVLVADPSSARAALEPLIEAFGVLVHEDGERLVLRSPASSPVVTIDRGDLVDTDDAPRIVAREAQDGELPGEIRLAFRDPLAGHAPAMAATLPVAPNLPQAVVDAPFSLEAALAGPLAEAMLARARGARRSVDFSLSPTRVDVRPGTVFRFADGRADETFVVTRVEQGERLKVEARSILTNPPRLPTGTLPVAIGGGPAGIAGPPLLRLIDLPLLPGAAPEACFRAALWTLPWTTQALLASPGADGFATRATILAAATVGTLAQPLAPGPVGVLDNGNVLRVVLAGGSLAAVSRSALLGGANLAAVHAGNGSWEVLQFQAAEETGPDEWRLAGLLRAQLGTDDAMFSGAVAGADFVLLDADVVPAGLTAAETGLELNWRAGPAAWPLDPLRYTAASAAGGVRALMPLSPAHLRAKTDAATGDVDITWIRRTRVDGDSWLGEDVPLGETVERYRIRIRNAGGTAIRTSEAVTSSWTYPLAAQVADFGGPVTSIDVEIKQLSERVGEGYPARRILAVTA